MKNIMQIGEWAAPTSNSVPLTNGAVLLNGSDIEHISTTQTPVLESNSWSHEQSFWRFLKKMKESEFSQIFQIFHFRQTATLSNQKKIQSYKPIRLAHSAHLYCKLVCTSPYVGKQPAIILGIYEIT